MKRYFKIYVLFLLAPALWVACSSDDFPVDEDGLLITERAEAYVGNFELLGVDHLSVISGTPEIDTVQGTVKVNVFYGTDLSNLYPQFSLVTDAKLEPKITGFVDFSDLSNPKTYTVISGNRQVRKDYQILITVLQP